eukprot:CAMPEP_0115847898 /NCGR_PEP_ID=MMETSP0287-20121206/10630_1 /TAXON_ID=412157 /ORGANISM="Chrysochromulina rotalis, Strain UIO044" /LENGTH=172 /DNA_ID=CAMNT_0003301767 /DNA_START=58 /DNA_END=575 /DNA_ORIENTATION=+
MKLPVPSDASGLGERFRTYLTIEVAWWVGAYGLCYRYRPSMAIMQTQLGRRVVSRVGSWLQRAWPSRYATIQSSANIGYTSQWRTFSEWLLINKALAPLSFPLKVAAANHIVSQRNAAEGLAATTLDSSPGILALAAAAHEPGVDLPPDKGGDTAVHEQGAWGECSIKHHWH